MRNLVILILVLIGCTSLGAQVTSSFNGKFNITSVTGTNPTFTINGVFSNETSQYNGTQADTTDKLFVLYNSKAWKLHIKTYTTKTSSVLSFTAVDSTGLLPLVPTGQAAIIRETPNFDFPYGVSGLRNDLAAAISNFYSNRVDEVLSNAGGDITGPFNNLQIAPGAVGTTELADTSVTADKLNDMGALANQYLKWDGVTWTPSYLPPEQFVDTLLFNNDTLYVSLSSDGVPAASLYLPLGGTGGGIYSPGSGTVPANTVADIPDGITFSTVVDSVNYRVALGNLFWSLLEVNADSVRIQHSDLAGVNKLYVNSEGVVVKTDGPDRFIITGNDARYAADESASFDSLSIINKGWADSTYIIREYSYGGVLGQVLKWDGTKWYPANDATGGSGAGENNTGENVGAGQGIYAGKTDTILQFKTLVEGYGIDYANDATTVTISVDTTQIATLDTVNSVAADLSVHVILDQDFSPLNELQSVDQFNISGDTLYLSLEDDGEAPKFVVLSDYLDNTDTSGYNLNFAISNDTIYLTDGDGTLFVKIPEAAYEDNQTLSLSNDTLYISQGNNVLLTGYKDNTDSQQLAIDSVIVGGLERFSISIDSGNTVRFDVPQNTDTSGYNISFTRSNDTLFIVDGNSALFVKLPESVATDTSGYNSQFNISNDTLYITDGDGTLGVNLDPYLDNTDNQTLTIDSTDVDGVIERFDITINNGNTIYLDVPKNIDTSGYNLSLSMSNDTLRLTDGAGQLFVTIPDASTTNELQTIDTFETVSNTINISLSSDGQLFKSTTILDSLLRISGKVYWWQRNTPMHRVAIIVTGSNVDTVYTDLFGNYTILVPAFGTYKITPYFYGNAYNGVTSQDATDITNALVSSPAFTSAFQTIAGDVNSSNSLNGTDASTINQALIGNAGAKAVFEAISWKFVRANHVFSSVFSPWGYPQDTTFTNLTTNKVNIDFIGIKVGDVNASGGTLDSLLGVDIDKKLSYVKYGLDTFSLSGDTLRISLRGDGVPASSVLLGAVDNQTLTIDSTDIGGTIERFGITISNGNTVYLDVPQVSGSGAGQNNVGANVGSGTGIYAGKVDTILQFKSLVEGYGIDLSSTATEVTIRVDTAQIATLNDVAVVQSDIDAHELVDGDLSATNEIQQIDTFEINANTLRISLSSDNVPLKSVDLAPYLDNTDTSGYNIALTISNDTLFLEDGNGVLSVELPASTDAQTLSIDSTTVGSIERFAVSISNGNTVRFDVQQDQTVVLSEGYGINNSGTYPNFTIAADTTELATVNDINIVQADIDAHELADGDLSATNEGSLTVGAGGANTSTIISNTSGSTPVTISGGVGTTVTESGSTITVAVDTTLLATVNDIVVDDVVTLADSAALKAYTGAATAVVLKQFGREGTFVRSSTTLPHDGYIVFTDGSNRKWKRVFNGPLNVKWFGAKGDGVTDDIYAIQRAIDYSIYTDTTIKQVYIPTGRYLISSTLHLGYGQAFHSVSLIGDGAPSFRGGVSEFNGTTIRCNFSNAPGINIQGARWTTVENISVVGLNAIAGFLYDTSSANINNWIHASVDTIGDNRRTPYAGITVDAYSGTAPTPAYPTVNYPTYANVPFQYSRIQSSQVKIVNCGVHEFIAGIVLQPNSDGNGDFIQIEKCIIDKVAYGVSVGNTNSRNLAIRDCYIDAHTCITNSTHGNRVGRITLVENCHFGGYQWFSLGALPYLEGFEVTNCYGEAFYWLGYIGDFAGGTPSIKFNSCDFSQTAIGNRNLSAFAKLSGDAAYVFDNCTFKGNRMYLFNNDDGAWLTFNQCKFSADVFDGEPGDSVETYHDKFFRSFLFLMSAYPDRTTVNQCRFNEFTETNPLAFPSTDGNGTGFPNRIEYVSYWRQRANSGVNVEFADLGYPNGYLGIGSGFDTYGFNGRTFTGKCKSTYKHGIGPGDLLLFKKGDAVLPVMITEIDAQDTITGLLMTNYKYDATGNFVGYFVDTSLTSSNVWHISCRKFLNNYTVVGDFTAGSNIVTNVLYTLDNANGATSLEQYTPLLNMDGYYNQRLAPYATNVWIDSIISPTSFRLSANALRTGTYPIQNCWIGDYQDRTIITNQHVAYGTGNGIKGESDFKYDEGSNRLGFSGADLSRTINMRLKAGDDGNNTGILFETDGTVGQDPVQKIEWESTEPGPFVQRGQISFDAFSNGGASPKGQAMIFALRTDGQSSSGTTALYENQIVFNCNQTNGFNIANNTGRLRFSSNGGIWSTDQNWIMSAGAYPSADADTRLKLVGAGSDSTNTKWPLRVFDGYQRLLFSVRNDGETIIGGGKTTSSKLLFMEPSGSGTNFTSIRANAQATNFEYVWPTDTATAGQVLAWNTGGQLSWEDRDAVISLYTASGTLFADGIATLAAASGFTFDYTGGADAIGLSGTGVIVSSPDAGTSLTVINGVLSGTSDITSSLGVTSGNTVTFTSNETQFAGPVAISPIGGSVAIDDNALLQLDGVGRVLLLNRLTTTERNALASPEDGALLYNTTTDALTVRANGAWVELGSGGGDGNGIYDGSGTIPNGTIATLTSLGNFIIDYNSSSPALSITDNSGVELYSPDGSGFLTAFNSALQIGAGTGRQLTINNTAITVQHDYVAIDGRTAANPGIIRFLEPNGTNYFSIQAQAMTADYVYVWPVDDGTPNQVLQTDGSGNLSWATASGGLVDGDYGDVDVTSSGTVLTVDTSAITSLKILDGTIANSDLSLGVGGIYKGSGTLSAGTTTATLPSNAIFKLAYNGGNSGFEVNDLLLSANMYSKDGTQYLSVDDTQVYIGSGTSKMEYIDGVLRLYDSDATHRVSIQTPATGSLTTNYTLTLPVDDGAPDQLLKTDGSGNLSWTTIAGGGDILNGGNTTGATVVIGTNDANALNLETNNVERMSITGGASTGGAFTFTNVTANTNTVQDVFTVRSNSTGTAGSNFGVGLLFQGESSTTNNRDMVKLSAIWTNATDAGRTSALSYSDVSAGGALTERFRFTPTGMNLQTSYTIGNTSNQVTIGGSNGNVLIGGSNGNVSISSSSTSSSAIQINPNGPTSSSRLRLGGTTYTNTSGVRYFSQWDAGFAPTSGTATFRAIGIENTINQTGGANGDTWAIQINPTLTAVGGTYYALDIATNSSSAKGIYQSGPNTINNFVGNTAFGTTSTPNTSALIDMVSTSKGFGAPVMTTAQRDAISSPREGLVVYSSDNDALNLRDGASIWKRLPTIQTVLKTADETVNNSNTYQADDHLTFTAKSGKKYVAKFYLYVEDPNFSNTTGGMKVKVTAPSATTLRYGSVGGAGIAATYGDGLTDILITDAFGLNPTEGFIVVTAYIDAGGSDRTVTLEWSQAFAHVGDSKILEGSFVEYEEVY